MQESREIKRYTDLAAFGYNEPMTLVESKKSGKVKVSWLSDEDIAKKRVSKAGLCCLSNHFETMNSFFSGTDDNTTILEQEIII